MHRAFGRWIVFAMVSSVAVTQAQDISPRMVACHNEATKRYLADFQQTGFRHKPLDGAPVLVTMFENTSLMYDEYLAECLKRWDREKPNEVPQ